MNKIIIPAKASNRLVNSGVNSDAVVKDEKGTCIFRNYTEDHWFIVGDKISYQVGDYKNPKKKYRIQGFVLALGYDTKKTPMYLIGNVNVVIYDTKKDIYISDKRGAFKWYSAKEIHALETEDNFIAPKSIGYKSNDTITRLIEGKSIHIIDVMRSTRYTKLSKYEVEPEFNINKTELPYYKFAKRNPELSESVNPDISKYFKYYDGVCAYYATDQIDAATKFAIKDPSICRIEIIRHNWDESKKKYIERKATYKYYVIVNLNKRE